MIFKDNFEKEKCLEFANQISKEVKLSKEVKQAFANTPREIFVPVSANAYELFATPIHKNQWISSPLTVAKMTMALDLKNTDCILEIGCGTGYQAALLSCLVRRVFSLERIQSLANSAIKNLNAIQAKVQVRYADGNLGFKNYAPYERILLSAYTKTIPDILFEQLEENGILVAPIGDENEQIITKFTKTKNEIKKELLDKCVFVPMLNGLE